MPFINVKESSYYERAILLQEVCGFIEPNSDRDFALQAIKLYLKNSNLNNWCNAIAINEKSLNENK